MGETRDWLKFFEQAGIPRSASAQYAVTFIDNRISMDMLMDLNKEYLRDMGISKLGDIISILKQAKAVSQKLSADKALSSKLEEEIESKSTKLSTKKAVPLTEDSSPRVPLKKKVAPTISKVEAPESERVVIRGKSPLSNRLGPPLEQKFPVSGGSKKKEGNVFERLGHSDKMGSQGSESDYVKKSRPAHQMDSSSPERSYSPNDNRTISGNESQKKVPNSGLVRKRIIDHHHQRDFFESEESKPKFSNPDSITALKRKAPSHNPTSSSHGLFNKSYESNWEKVPVQKRLGSIRPVPATASEEECNKPKKVKYVMVKTLQDGSQVRKTLRPDDPLLKRVPITKTRVKAISPEPPRSLSPVPRKRVIISTKKPYEGFSLNRSLPERSSDSNHTQQRQHFKSSFDTRDSFEVSAGSHHHNRSRSFDNNPRNSFSARKPTYHSSKRSY